MLATAIEAEVAAFLEQHGNLKTDEGKPVVVRNGYLPERAIQTGLGNIEVKVPKVRDRSGPGIKFNSSLIPPYLKRTRNIEEFLPWLYLRGISTGDFAKDAEAPSGARCAGIVIYHERAFKAGIGTGLSKLESPRPEQKTVRLCLG